ncbi:MAG: oxygen-independent coproporphyrinogen III oxidase, partial [Bacillus sp. (in: firmicutes)]
RTTKAEQMEEEMFLGLRKTKGVSVSHFIDKFNVDPLLLFEKEIADLTDKQWLTVEKDHIFLTKNGRLLGNEVFQSFLGVSND